MVDKFRQSFNCKSVNSIFLFMNNCFITSLHSTFNHFHCIITYLNSIFTKFTERIIEGILTKKLESLAELKFDPGFRVIGELTRYWVSIWLKYFQLPGIPDEILVLPVIQLLDQNNSIFLSVLNDIIIIPNSVTHSMQSPCFGSRMNIFLLSLIAIAFSIVSLMDGAGKSLFYFFIH